MSGRPSAFITTMASFVTGVIDSAPVWRDRIGMLEPITLVAIIAVAAALTPARLLVAQDAATPRDRQLPVFVYDSVGDRLLLYGGLLGPNLEDIDPKTYAWRDGRWSVIAQTGPRSRDDIAYGLDPRASTVVMFGGRGRPVPGGRPGAYRETWRFDGTRWALLDTLGPNGRAHSQGAFDVVRNRFVVFGGADGAHANGPVTTDTWEWDGAKWTRFDTPGPPGRTGHVMAYDRAMKVVIVHGGVRNADRVALTDTWAWDGERWRLLTMEGPRTIFGAAASAPDRGIIVFGGHTLDGKSNATWYWNGKAWRRVATEGPAPAARIFNALATDTRRRRVYMLGGGDNTGDGWRTYNDMWYLDADLRWVQLGLDERVKGSEILKFRRGEISRSLTP